MVEKWMIPFSTIHQMIQRRLKERIQQGKDGYRRKLEQELQQNN